MDTEVPKDASSQNTIFDDVFRTIAEKMPTLFIAAVNYIFGTDYPYTEEIVQLRNEHHVFDEIHVTDCYFMIRNRHFHIECQNMNDKTMGRRIMGYKLENAYDAAASVSLKDNVVLTETKLSSSCVIFLQCTKSTPKQFITVIKNEHGDEIRQNERCIRLVDIDLQKMLEEDLLILLPFYILKYKNGFNSRRKERQEAALSSWQQDCTVIRRTLQNNKKMDLLGVSYVDMIDLIVKIADYVINASNAGMEFKERIKTMQGKVLTLPSEIIAEEKAKCKYLKKELDKANAQCEHFEKEYSKANAQCDEMFKCYLAMIRNGVVKEEDVLTLMSDNTKNEFLKWIESNGNG